MGPHLHAGDKRVRYGSIFGRKTRSQVSGGKYGIYFLNCTLKKRCLEVSGLPDLSLVPRGSFHLQVGLKLFLLGLHVSLANK